MNRSFTVTIFETKNYLSLRFQRWENPFLSVQPSYKTSIFEFRLAS